MDEKKKPEIFMTFFCIISLIVIIGIVTIALEFTCHGCEPNENNVNPICELCGERDSIRLHDCKNPDGEPLYCRECGKLKIRFDFSPRLFTQIVVINQLNGYVLK